jgi:hypothetical protein
MVVQSSMMLLSGVKGLGTVDSNQKRSRRSAGRGRHATHLLLTPLRLSTFITNFILLGES